MKFVPILDVMKFAPILNIMKFAPDEGSPRDFPRRIALPLEMNCPGGAGHRFRGYVSPLPTQLYVNYAGAMRDGQSR